MHDFHLLPSLQTSRNNRENTELTVEMPVQIRSESDSWQFMEEI